MHKYKWMWIGKMLLLAPLFIGAIGWVTMTLWNWLVPELFAGPTISFWQALGLLLLSKILLPSWGGGGWKKHKKQHWKQKMEEKLSRMTPEQRARFKQGFRGGCFTEEKRQTREAETMENEVH